MTAFFTAKKSKVFTLVTTLTAMTYINLITLNANVIN